jgi:carboxymethylenebutenolidase
MGLGLAAAGSLLAACGTGDDDDAAPATSTTAAAGAVTTTTTATAAAAGSAELIRFAGKSGQVQGAFAAAKDPKGSLLVIHENRGLTPHFHTLVGRLAADGYSALAVDLLSPEGGTAGLTDPAAAPAALSAAPADRLLGDLRAGIDELLRRVPGKKVGAVGFCFGGGMTWSLLNAGEARLAAAAPFYGPAPDPADFKGAKAAVLGVYAELDTRVNATRDRAEAALKAAGLTYEMRTFAGADHAFFNDTGARYNEKAATEARAALLAWMGKHLA